MDRERAPFLIFLVSIPGIQNHRILFDVLFAIEGDRVDFMKMKGDILEKVLGSWGGKSKGDSISYVREFRKEWGVRAKRVNQWK